MCCSCPSSLPLFFCQGFTLLLQSCHAPSMLKGRYKVVSCCRLEGAHCKLGINVGPMREQLCNSLCMALDCSFVQGCHAMLICCIHIGSAVLQQLHKLHVPLQGCQMERCAAPLDMHQATSMPTCYMEHVVFLDMSMLVVEDR